MMIWNWLWSYWEGKRNLNLNLHIRARTRSMVYTIRLSLWFFLLFHLGREKGRRRGSFMEEKKVENEGGRISYDGSALPSPHRGMSFFFLYRFLAFTRSLLTCLIRWIRWGRPFWPWPLFFKKDRCKKKAKKRREDRGREKGGKTSKSEIMDRYPLYFGFTSTQYYFLLVPMDISTN